MKNYRITRIYLIIIVLLTSCSSNLRTLPDVGFKMDEFNTDLEIKIVKSLNSFSIGNEVTALVTLKTDIEIEAPIDFNLLIFEYDRENNNWKKQTILCHMQAINQTWDQI